MSSAYTSIIPLLIDAAKEIAQQISGFAEKFTTKELVATHVFGDTGTFKKLCVEKSDGTPVCVTGDELSSLLSGSVLGATAQQEGKEAAGASSPSGSEAPSGSSAPEATNADAAASNTAASEASSTPLDISPANDNQRRPPHEAGVAEPATDNEPASSEPAATIDNSPAEDPATGTE